MPPRKLSPVPNPASYPTQQQALGRRLVLGGIGAATLLGSACFFPAGEMAIVPGPDASVIQDAGPADAGPRDAAQPSDAEMLGGVAPPEDGGR
jgi:hypothetical protein